MRVLVAIAGLMIAAPAAAQEAPLLPWLVGEWCSAPANDKTSCERWEALPDGSLRGTARTLHSHHITLDETMRIAREQGQLRFHAKPAGQAGGSFDGAEDAAAQSVRFENRAHDYPQVVRYWREGAALLAEISLADGSKARRWRFERKQGAR